MGHLAVIPTLKTVIFEAEKLGLDPFEVTSMFLMDIDDALFGMRFALSQLRPQSREAEGWRTLFEGVSHLTPTAWLKVSTDALRMIQKMGNLGE